MDVSYATYVSYAIYASYVMYVAFLRRKNSYGVHFVEGLFHLWPSGHRLFKEVLRCSTQFNA